jgi:hypothetical protein
VIKEVATYVGSLLAIAFGVALIWFPPANLAGQAGTVGAAFSFVTGGLAAVGIAVTVPSVREQARRQGAAEATGRG